MCQHLTSAFKPLTPGLFQTRVCCSVSHDTRNATDRPTQKVLKYPSQADTTNAANTPDRPTQQILQISQIDRQKILRIPHTGRHNKYYKYPGQADTKNTTNTPGLCRQISSGPHVRDVNGRSSCRLPTSPRLVIFVLKRANSNGNLNRTFAYLLHYGTYIGARFQTASLTV